MNQPTLGENVSNASCNTRYVLKWFVMSKLCGQAHCYYTAACVTCLCSLHEVTALAVKGRSPFLFIGAL